MSDFFDGFFHWLARIKGIIITLFAILFLELMARNASPISYPGLVFLPAVAYATFVGGIPIGMMSGAIAFSYATFFSTPGQFFPRTFEDVQRAVVMAGAILAIVAMVGVLKRRVENAATVLARHAVAEERSVERKRAEEKLHESEERFRALIENSSDAIALLSPDGTMLFQSPSVRRVLGYDSAELVGRSVFDLVHPDDVKNKPNFLKRLLKNPGEIATDQYRLLHKDGSWRWIEGDAQNLLAEPSIQAIVVNYRDITERKRAEDNVKRRTQQLATIIEISRAVSTLSKVESVLQLIYEQVQRVITLDAFYVCLYNAQSEELAYPLLYDAGVRYDEPSSRMKRGTLLSKTILNGTPLLINKSPEELSKQQISLNALGDQTKVSASILFAPLFSGSTVIGAISTQSYTLNAYTQEHLDLLTGIAYQAAIAIQNARAFEETQQRADRLSLLNRIANTIVTTLDLNERLETVYREVTAALRCDAFVLALYDRDANELDIRIREDMGKREPPVRRPMGTGLISFVIENKRALLIRNYEREKESLPKVNVFGTMQMPNSWLGVPLYVGTEVIGAISVQFYLPDAYGDTELELLSTIANTVAVSIQNARLFEETSSRATQMALLYDAGLTLNRELDENAQRQFLLKLAVKAVQATRANFFSYDAAREELVLSHGVGTSAEVEKKLRGATFRADQAATVPGWVSVHRLPLIIPDLKQDARWKRLDPEIQSGLWVPVQHEAKFLGVIAVLSPRVNAFTPHDERLLILFGNQVAIAMENARLLEETKTQAEELAHSNTMLSSLNRIAAHSQTHLQPEDIYATLDRELKAIGIESAVFEIEPEGEAMRLRYLSLEARALAVAEKLTGIPVKDLRVSNARFAPYETVVQKHATVIFPNVAEIAEQMVPMIPPAILRRAFEIVGLKDSQRALFAPLMAEERAFGVLGMMSEHLRASDIPSATIFANQLSIALQNARLFEQTRQRVQELEALAQVSQALRAARNLEELRERILQSTVRVLNARAGSFFLFDRQKQELIRAEAIGYPVAFGKLRFKLGEGIAGECALKAEPILLEDISTDPRIVERDAFRDLHKAIIFPIKTVEGVIGVLAISFSERGLPTFTEINIVSTIGEIAGNAIHRMQLHEETQSHLAQLAALREIDRSISSSLNLQLTLGILLKQTIQQLHADAAAILLLNPNTQTLEFGSASGLRTNELKSARIKLGSPYAGYAALERKSVLIPDLRDVRETFVQEKFIAAEEFRAYFCVPLIAKGEVKGVLEVFQRAPFQPSPEWIGFLESLASSASIAIENAQLFENLQRSNINLSLAYDRTIEGWSRALDLRDKETEGHTLRVTEMTLTLARAMGIREEELVHVRRGALLHDIGKMGIPDQILLKPGALTDVEWEMMRRHPVYAFDLLAPIDFLRPALDIPYAHHEKWDGGGYPRGLKGEQIPLLARIFAVVDVYDALTSDRLYRKAWSKEKTLEHIKSLRGMHFDPRVLDAFLEMIKE
ncbi:MAG: GAF domain-containing protein [Chloroflexi bacterium]|nr:GAF domain-containing protein [Chloroflexota bacterium]